MSDDKQRLARAVRRDPPPRRALQDDVRACPSTRSTATWPDARPVPVHPRPARRRLPLTALDDAHVRRLRHRGGHQRPLQGDPPQRRHGPLHRLRHADPHGLRLRRSPWSLGEVGRAGVAVDTLRDMEDLYADIDLGKVSTSMTINGPAAALLAMYIAVAETERRRQGRPGRHHPERHLEGVPGAEGVHLSPAPQSMRIVTDMIQYTSAEMPKWHPVSISGYHIREAGSTAAQELAFTLANGFAYVEAALAEGQDVDDSSAAGCRSSSTPTSTSSRRSASSAPPAASGPAG